MIASGDLDFSFSGLKTAVATLCARHALDAPMRADVAHAFEEAVVEVLVAKCSSAMERTGLERLVVAGGVSANLKLRAALDRAAAGAGFDVYYPPLEFCTDNGAMIALAGALRLGTGPSIMEAASPRCAFTVRPRWDLSEILR